ncbi:MAG: hypothetical protein JSR71_10020 [Proteobacteria bacterium]|nr:hypothetical protein [Pseudomonadota bacterium]
MQISKSIPAIFLAVVSFLATPAIAVEGIDENDHAALAQYYENLADETKVKLQQNKALLEQYEMHPYYFGRQGQDIKSHSSANIREYEKILRQFLKKADLHKRMAADQANSTLNKAKINHNWGTTVIR